MMLTPLVALLPLFGGPEIKWNAPAAFVAGQPFKVHVEITAPREGTVVASWLLNESAFTVDGRTLGKREDAGTLTLPGGFKIVGDVDLAAYLPATAGEFQLGYATDLVEGGKPVTVQRLDPAPSGLNYMEMPAEALADYRVLLQTNRGDILLKFWPEVAPGHVRNYLDLASSKFYDGTTFHRVIPGFMIQGGDPTGTGTGDGKRQLKAEFSKEKKHLPGVLSMARSASPDSASCQFFIMHAAYPSLDGSYTAFGETVYGLDVVDRIVNTPRGPGDKPREPQTIQHALVLKVAGK